MNVSPAPGTHLRALLSARQLVVAPGCYDGTTARMVAAHGFLAAYVSGASVAALELGRPDLGFAGVAEFLQMIRRVVPALSSVPVIADADTGFGDAVQVGETVRRYEQAGVAGLHLEDQLMPKRCGHMSGKKLVDSDTASTRIRAASRARSHMVIIARTDALSVEGLDGAIARSAAYVEAGADALFVEGLSNVDEIDQVRRTVGDIPLVISLSEAGGQVRLTVDDLRSAGVAIAIVPVAGLLAALAAFRAVLRNLTQHGHATPVDQLTWPELTDLLGLPSLIEFENAVRTVGATTH